MHATMSPLPASQLPIARIRNAPDLFVLIPRQICNLLLVVDPAAEPDLILTIALEVAERWAPQMTFVHGGRLLGCEMTDEISTETALAEMLCLSWQVKGAYRDVSISQTLPGSLPEVLEEAAQRKADVILLPERLSARLRDPELLMSGSSRLISPCPIVVVMEPESDWCGDKRCER